MPRLARILAVALVIPALIAACSTAPGGIAPVAPVSVKTAPIAPTNIVGKVTYSSNVASQAKISLLPKIAGQITVLNVEVGSVVKPGDVIAELDHASLDAQIDQAQAGLAAAKAKLATIQSGPRSEYVAQAQANLQAAQDNLTYMQGGGRPETIAAAQGGYAAAQGGYTAAQGGYTAAQGRLQGLTQGRVEQVTQAKANLQAAQAKLQQIKDGPTSQQIAAGQLAVEQAKDASYAANVQKDAACNSRNPAAACNAAQAIAYAAQTGIDQANQQLKILTTPPSAEVIQQAQSAIDAAQAQVLIAQHPGSAADVTAAQGAVASAQGALATASGALASAQAQIDLAKSPYSTADLAKAQAAADVAKQQLSLAQTPYTQQDVDVANAAVQQAQAAVEVAQVSRDSAIVKSPVDGLVAERPLSVGALAAPTTPIVVIMDPKVDAVVNADAVQASSFKVGDAATITADTLPGKSIPATITQISPAVDPRARTVQFKVTPTSQDSGLKDGMLAQVTLVTAAHNGVLAVPSSAVVQRNGQPTVYLVSNGVASPVAVQIGLSDGTNVELTSGVQAGQLVVISGQDQLTAAQPVVVQK
jgi:RND family efflux transporter MFP subunit